MQKYLTFKCKSCMSIRVVTLFSQLDPGGLTSLLLMKTELLMPAVIWSVGSETTSPPPHTIASSIRPLQTLPLSISQHLLLNEGKQRKGNSQMKQRPPPLWQLQGNRANVIWHCWAKSPWVLYRLHTVVYCTHVYRLLFTLCFAVLCVSLYHVQSLINCVFNLLVCLCTAALMIHYLHVHDI